MDGHRLQRGADVHWPVLGLSRWLVGSSPCAAGLCRDLHRHQHRSALRAQLPGTDCTVGSRGPDLRNFLSPHAFLCAAQSAAEVSALRDCCLRHGHHLHHQHRAFRRSLVHGVPLVAMDLLEQRCADTDHDGADLFRSSLAALATAKRRPTETELARISLRQRWLRPHLYGA